MRDTDQNNTENTDEIWDYLLIGGIMASGAGVALPFGMACDPVPIFTLIGGGLIFAVIGTVGKLLSCCIRVISNQNPCSANRKGVIASPPALAKHPTCYHTHTSAATDLKAQEQHKQHNSGSHKKRKKH